MKSFASIAHASAAVLACSSLALLGASSAQADILPSSGTPDIKSSGIGTQFTYNVFVTQAQSVVEGDFFTIYDFAGLTGTPSAPAGFTSSVSLLDTPVMTPFGSIAPNDDPNIDNVTFTYSGPTIPGGPTNLGDFILKSTFTLPLVRVTFVGRGTDQDTGFKNGNITNTLGPSTDSRPGDVPEPGAYMFAVLAAGSVLCLVARKRKA